MDDIQKAIDAGATAPRVTPADLEAEIRAEVYFTGQDGIDGGINNKTGRVKSEYREGEHILAPLALLTFCVLVLRNGFTVTGQSACVSAENFDAEIGRKIARENAIQKLWPLLGFRLADRLAAGAATSPGFATDRD